MRNEWLIATNVATAAPVEISCTAHPMKMGMNDRLA